MKKTYRSIESWFIGDYLMETPNIFEKSKIKLIYKFAILSSISIFLSLPMVYEMHKIAFFMAIFCFVFMGSIPFLLKKTKSVGNTSKVVLTFCFLNLTNIYFILNRPDPMGIGAWFITLIIIACFILGRRWGLFFISLSLGAVLLMIGLQFNETSLYGLEKSFNPLENKSILLSTPIRVFLPILIIYFIILEFLKSKAATDHKMQQMYEEQKGLNEKIKASEEKYRRFIEDADDLIYELDGLGRFTYVNPAFEKIGGYKIEDLTEKTFNFFVKETFKTQLHKALYKQMKSCTELSYHEFPIVNKNQEDVWIGQKTKMVFDGNIFVKAICIGREITAQKMTEQALISATEEAVKASEAKAEFLSSMSHEIRTPMNAVIGMTHLLLEENPRPDQIENIKTLKFSGENLLTIINDILDFSKIESGKLTIEKTSFNLKYVVGSIYHALSIKAIDKNIKLLNKFDAAVPEFVIGDSVRLYQILNNLIGNAIKFTKEGHVIVQTSLRKEEKDEVVIDFSIMDTGIGIPEDKVETIFENFTQANESTTRNFGGTGLGLAITKKLLDLQGSKIRVRSVFGKGSHFYFSLRFKKSVQKKLPESVRLRHEKQSVESNLKGVNILLVEDNRVNQLVAKKFISKWGATMKVAENGVEAIQFVQKEKFDLVLMDLQMPVMGGMEATEKIRKLGKQYLDLPIIALTASAVLEVQDEAIEAGMNDFITKPFDPNVLLSKLKTYSSSLKVNNESMLQVPK